MPRPYSLDLRERVVRAFNNGEPCRAVAKKFGVSVSSVVKWRQRLQKTGSVAPLPMGGRRPLVLAAHRDWLLKRISAEPHVTLRGLMGELAERQIVVSYGAIWNFLHREGLSFKKKHGRQRAGSS